MSERLQALADGASETAPKGLAGWFAGRARRREYWLWVAPATIIGFTLSALQVPGVTLLMGLPILLIWIRRLHDLGHSGWFAPLINVGINVTSFAAIGLLSASLGGLIALAIYLSAILVMGILPGQPKPNEFGPPPGTRAVSEVFS